MSTTGDTLALATAVRIADAIVDQLRPYCEQICVAGSIRRRVAIVHDVELVVVPTFRQPLIPLFGDVDVLSDRPLVDELDENLNMLVARRAIRKRRDRSGHTFWGPSDKRIAWPIEDGGYVAVDVFGATGPSFGAKLAIRTGPWQLSKRLVTPRAKGGLMPDDLQFRDGGLWRFDAQSGRHARSFVPTPDEDTVFRELGLPYVAPEHRFATTFDREHAGRSRWSS